MASKTTFPVTVLKPLGTLCSKLPYTAHQAKVEEYISTLGLKRHTYLVEHAQAYLVSKHPFLGSDTFKGLAEDALALGSYLFLKHAVGSVLIHSQPKEPQYSAFVPLVLQGYKKFSSIKYSQWPNIQAHISAELFTAVSLVQYPQVTPEFLAERNSLLEESRFKSLHTCSSPRVKVYPSNYANCMYFQTWLAHPEIRHPDMLLDLKNPDVLPEAYVKAESVLLDLDSSMEEAIKEALKITKEYQGSVVDVMPWEQ